MKPTKIEKSTEETKNNSDLKEFGSAIEQFLTTDDAIFNITSSKLFAELSQKGLSIDPFVFNAFWDSAKSLVRDISHPLKAVASIEGVLWVNGITPDEEQLLLKYINIYLKKKAKDKSFHGAHSLLIYNNLLMLRTTKNQNEEKSNNQLKAENDIRKSIQIQLKKQHEEGWQHFFKTETDYHAFSSTLVSFFTGKKSEKIEEIILCTRTQTKIGRALKNIYRINGQKILKQDPAFLRHLKFLNYFKNASLEDIYHILTH